MHTQATHFFSLPPPRPRPPTSLHCHCIDIMQDNIQANDTTSTTTTTNPINITEQDTVSCGGNHHDDDNDLPYNTNKYKSLLYGFGGALFLFPHMAMLLSLPPVLRRRGAPYLPTFHNKQNVMFDRIRKHILSSSQSSSSSQKQKQSSPPQPPPPLQFVDLGSGDGRIVFRASRENLFAKCVGYEINPALHIVANVRRLVTPRYWSTTNFYMTDLWKTKLHQYDVVTIYGLPPIMERLGRKLEQELKPGSIVVSNVFEIPGWKVVSESDTVDGGIGKGVHLYHVPECFKKRR
jgi:hypothetical protein